MKEKKRLLLISADAMVFEDLKYLEELPQIRRLIENGSRVNRAKSIYPTLTYPCHTTMISGCFPDRHGVVNNEEFQPGKTGGPWNWYHSSVKIRDLFDACKEAGYTTGAVGWPVTGNHPSVDYLVDEIWPRGIADVKEAAAAFRELLRRSGTSEDVMRSCVNGLEELRVQRRQPDTSWFNTKVCCNIIRRYRPEFIALHLGNIDHYRHKKGVFGEHIRQGMIETDEMLSAITAALKEAGVFEETNIVLTADHGQLDTDRKAAPNVLLRENGLIRTDTQGEVIDWDAWCHAAGTSAQIYLKDPADKEQTARVRDLFLTALSEGNCGFERVYEGRELAKQNLPDSISFVLETDGHTGFVSDWSGDYLRTLPNLAGSHGYHPEKGPRPTIICCGPSFQKGVVIENTSIVDGAPTWARLLRVSLPETDGHVLSELLA